MSAELPAVPSVKTESKSTTQTRLIRIEAWLERTGERLNPILVKEARQALKSRQFTITFTLLLIAAWIWSLGGIVTLMPDVYYSSNGRYMLTGYYFILAFPLLLIVPFAAFRSLASEREDGTYELLSITSLSSRQVVTGKLGSSILQMLVYYSALAPCIAFTYLLRGVAVLTVILLLFYTFVGSVMLSVAGLLLAAISRTRVWQMLISVGMLVGLVVLAWNWAYMVMQILNSPEVFPTDDVDFWIGNGVVLTAIGSYFAILLLVAAAQNSFASDNRSTSVRIAMLVQTVLFFGWTAYLWLRWAVWQAPLLMLIFAAAHWYVYGVFLTGESAELSPRVRRNLPQSAMGRLFLTWFNPGSGTGYVFAVTTFGTLTLLLGLGLYFSNQYVNVNVPTFAGALLGFQQRLLEFYLLLVAYFVIYLGIGRLLILLIRTRYRVGLHFPVLIHVLVLAMGCGVPMFLDMWINGYQSLDYTPLQAPNWYWTLQEVLDFGSRLRTYAGVPVLVVCTALLVFLLNLIFVVGEVRQLRVESPARVREDDSSADSEPDDLLTTVSTVEC